MKIEINDSLSDTDLKLNLDDNLKSSLAFCKTNSVIINNLLDEYINNDFIKEKENQKEKTKNDKGTNPDILRKQKLFASKKFYTKTELRKKMNNVFQSKKRMSIKNFNNNLINVINKNNQFNHNFTIKNLQMENNSKKKKRYIEYDDLYFEDDMFIPESSSFPNEKEEDFLLKLKFIEENDFNDDIENFNIRHCSINYKKNQRDQTYIKYFNNQKNEISEKKLPELDNIFKDEKEIIKKVTLENFRNKFAFIYKCFLEQFKYFMPINSLVNKIFSAFYYYHETMKVDSTELLLFLNTLIYENFELIKEDKITLKQLQDFYKKINEINWENPEIIQDLKSLDYLLFKSFENIEFKNDVNENENSIKINEIKKQSHPFEMNKSKIVNTSNKKIINNKSNEKKMKYFYILNFKKEEIAQYLTCESYQILSDIPESELYNKNFARKDKDIRAPHIKKIFDRYEKLTYFIIEDISSYDHASERVDIIEKWIRIAFVCYELKNYDDLIMLNTLFYHYLLKKNLKRTWSKLSKKALNYLDKINKFCDGAQCYKKIRNEIFKCKGPYVPYIGILLKQLTYIEEKKYIIDNNNININKLTELNKTIGKFFEFKKYKYYFDKSKNLEVLSNVNPKSGDEIENIIKQLEPKLLIHAKKGDKKRLTKTDEMFYG